MQKNDSAPLKPKHGTSFLTVSPLPKTWHERTQESFQTWKEAVREQPSAHSNVFIDVAEYEHYATNDPGKLIASRNVAQCLVLDITNCDNNKEVTHRSVSHLHVGQLFNPYFAEKMLEPIFEEFKKVGGDPENANFTIYGGTEKFSDQASSNLNHAIKQKVSSVKIERKKPSINKDGELIEIYFTGKSLDPAFCYRRKQVNGQVQTHDLMGTITDKNSFSNLGSNLQKIYTKERKALRIDNRDKIIQDASKLNDQLLQSAGDVGKLQTENLFADHHKSKGVAEQYVNAVSPRVTLSVWHYNSKETSLVR